MLSQAIRTTSEVPSNRLAYMDASRPANRLSLAPLEVSAYIGDTVSAYRRCERSCSANIIEHRMLLTYHQLIATDGGSVISSASGSAVVVGGVELSHQPI